MQVSLMKDRLRDLSPYSILNRGYSITRKLPEEAVLRGVKGIRKGDRVRVSLAEGELECGVEKIVSS
jgi:exodeoxyribonuclease VII large subunit